jgi:UDP-2-acetamido-3-amino-2,3-dideoxy-glucuronate N-acetyltransferase
MGLPPGTFCHPLALCESNDVGESTRIWAFAHVMPTAVIGSHCNICDHVFVESGVVIGDGVTVKNNSLLFDGVTIEDNVFVGPNTVFTNDRRPRAPRVRENEWTLERTRVCRGASIGANAVIICGVTIGAYAMIGAGSVVVSDVPEHSLMIGNPAAPAGWVCSCGARLSEALRCSCGRVYRTVPGDQGPLLQREKR